MSEAKKTSFFQKLKNFFSRFLVYHMIIIWLYMKFADIDKSTNDFKTRIKKNLHHFGLKGSALDGMMEEPVLIHLGLVLSELVWLVLAMFGSKLGAWMIAGHFGFTTFLFFNPFLPENNFNIWKMDIRPDMLSSFGVLSCFYLIAYFPEEIEEKNHTVDDVDHDDEETDEQIESSKNKKESSKKGKKVKTK